MANDEEDFVFYGTPIGREEEFTSRKKKAVAEASGQLRTALPPWKQEVTDEEGRRRFHGAFTGGYSAGYYNTVGSKEGWTPQSFTSSRKSRAEVTKQNIFNFLDEDEKADLEGRSLGSSMQFDTFGFTAAELARKEADKDQQQRPSAIPGPVPDELVVPATESIGIKLLIKMGWRPGRSIKDSNRNSLDVARREARKAFLALSSDAGPNTARSKLTEEDTGKDLDLPANDDDRFYKTVPAYVVDPKQDLYGLGYDPFKQAPEFREKKRQRMSGKGNMEPFRSLTSKGKIGPGFGIGALEDLDAEDEDIYDTGIDVQDTYVQEIEEPSVAKVDTLRILDKKKDDVLPGFKAASKSEHQLERFNPPSIPEDFVPHHKFPVSADNDGKNAEIPPTEIPPPEDHNLKVLIEGVATLVARCGKLFEDLSKEKNQVNPLFAFLSGGTGSDYYARKLWEERQKRGEQHKLWEEKKPNNSEKLTAERRGAILGEKALERNSRDSSSMVASSASVNVQIKLSDTFTKPSSANEQADVRKPFQYDPAKQIRFEQFLKEKFEGGLRTKDSGGSSDMSEAVRARERLEFEEAAAVVQKAKLGNERQVSSQLLKDLSAVSGLQFTAGGVEKHTSSLEDELIAKAMYPKREEFQWRPAPILCKRFDLIDPYMGKPPPAQRVKSKMDSLIFMPDSIRAADVQEQVPGERRSSSQPQGHSRKKENEAIEKEAENEVEVENVERPVDLYKAIFSDDSDDEEENSTSNQAADTEKKIEAANTTLNRLMAGDFLETLGKELGLLVPPEMPPPENKAGKRVATDADERYESPLPAKITMPVDQRAGQSSKNGASTHDSDGKETKSGKVRGEDAYLSSGKASSSEDERSKKHSRSHRHKRRRSRSSDTDSSDDSDVRGHHSRSRTDDKETSRGKSSSRRHSKHGKHKRKDSPPSRSHRASEHEERNKRKKKR
ncbi:G patch domain-containing protein TGH-like [Salvia splendens]|uniref:G patch domain-containing protein TGH-like n=1 Tax=Salvia splendens TaxID=180675 RepID=UPI001C27CF14|nr:G patch domain-containing protein TGH-like [Salvia splendens]